jgi:competence protein ComEC
MPNRKLTRAQILTEKLRPMPLLKALGPMMAGVAAGSLTDIPIAFWIVATVICAAIGALVLWRRGGGTLATIYVGCATLFFGAVSARIHTPVETITRGERLWIEMRITDNPTHRDGQRSASTFGVATRWRSENGEWQKAGERLLVSIDTMWRFGAGDRVVFRGYVNPVTGNGDQGNPHDPDNGYARLMRARGYTGRTYISQYSAPEPIRRGRAFFKDIQSAATSRLALLHLDSDALAVATAMTTGDRSGITPELRGAYSRTGASHLLAVSGLHVGIVFLMVNVLMFGLSFVRRGHIVGNVVAVVVIWLYAALTGLSPSAMRAAFMFSGAQVALATSRNRSAANIMCGTAMVMLAVWPGLLFDISFQLSFIAVAAIITWYSPIYRALQSRWRVVNTLWAAIITGLVASVATVPLVSHTFGVFSPAGVVLNPVVLATAYLIVVFSLVWIALPAGFWQPFFEWMTGGPAWLQNRVVESVAAVPGVAVEWRMPLWAVFVSYGAMIIFTAWFASRPDKSGEPGPLILPR